MTRRTYLLLFLTLSAIFLLTAAMAPPPPVVQGDAVVLRGADFERSRATVLAVTEEGLRLPEGSMIGTYESAPLEAPLPFTAVVPEWLATLPEGAAFSFSVRTAGSDGLWSPWVVIEENHDWMLPGERLRVGTMVVAPAPYETHRRLQFKVALSDPQGEASALLEELRFNFIDGRSDLPAGSPIAPETPEPGYPKPPVVPRTSWCTDSACTYSAGIEYYPVNHLLVHHTVTANTATNWEAIVRAIWYYHAFTRGWGDIGYNYLVDPNGTVYEGHRGGDDVVGTHAAGANRGSMGTALMGTFTAPYENPPGIVPPAAMQNSLVELLAWKADQKDIDVFSSSDGLPDLGWGIPNLAGHRDVYGTTSCPGVQAHDLLPELRQRVANKIGFVSPHIYVDEESGAFTASNNGHWYVGPYQCGFNQRALYTYSVTDPAYSTNWGRWQPDLPNSGRYEIEVLAPYCNTGEADTEGAVYEVHHTGGVTNVVANQDANLGEWISLGEFTLNDSSYVYLTDISATESNAGVWFDAVRYRYLNATAVNGAPVTGVWLNQRTNTFSWSVGNQASLDHLTLQVATDSQLHNLVHSETLAPTATSRSVTLNQDYSRLYWRVVLHNRDGNLGYSPATWFGLDATPPASSVTGVVLTPTGNYAVLLSGSDATSGISAYDVQFRRNDSSTWQTLGRTSNNAITFIPPQPGQIYWFRSRAVDVAGNSGAFTGSGDLSTNNALPYVYDTFLPTIQR